MRVQQIKDLAGWLIIIGAGLAFISALILSDAGRQEAERAWDLTACQKESLGLPLSGFDRINLEAGCPPPSQVALENLKTAGNLILVSGLLALGVGLWLRWSSANRPELFSKNKNDNTSFPKKSSSDDLARKLRALQKLKKEGLISESELKKRREQLLNNI